MISRDVYIDEIAQAVTSKQEQPKPIPLLIVEGYCFLADDFVPKPKCSIAEVLAATLNNGSSYATSRSIVEQVEPDPAPMSEELAGPRYVFRLREAAA